MTGWRAKIGSVVLSFDQVSESEFFRMAPPGVSVHFTRIPFGSADPTCYDAILGRLPQATALLADAQVEAVSFSCATGSMYGGIGYDEQVIAEMRRGIRAPCTTTATAIVAALQHVKAATIAVATPYEDWLNEVYRRFLEASGFAVAEIASLKDCDPAKVHPEELYRFALSVGSVKSDALLIGCTGIRTIEILNVLETSLGKPVLSANQATMWMLLNLAGVGTKEMAGRFGSLLC